MSTYSNNLRIELITTGTQAGTWGDTTNTNLGTVIEDSIAGYVTVSVISANQAFTAIDGAADQARNAMLRLTTSTGANFAVYAPPVSKQYIILNDSAYTATIYNSTVVGNTTPAGTGVAIPAGKTMAVWSEGTDFRVQNNYVVADVVGNVTGNVTGQLTGSIASTTTATTQAPGTNNTTVATTAFVAAASGLGDPGANGVVVRTALNTTTARTITAGTGISVSNGDGLSGNPTITNSGVTTFNGSSGAVTYTAPVTSVNGQTGAVTIQTVPTTFNEVGTTAICACTSSSQINVGSTLSGAYLFTGVGPNVNVSLSTSGPGTGNVPGNVVNNTSSFSDDATITWTSIGSGTWILCGPLRHNGATYNVGGGVTQGVSLLLWRRIS